MPPLLRRLLLAILLLITAVPAEAAGDAEPAGPPLNRLEEAYSRRAGEDLRQYGYALFQQGGTRAEPALGTIADGHLLGPGDILTVTLRGQTASQTTHGVGTDGLLIVEGLRPIMAAGRSLGEVRAEVEAEVASTLFDTRAFVTLSSPRRLSVLVLGDVQRPGRHDLSAFATVLDALFAAGGVLPSGSLRAIRLIQPGGQGTALPVDLYDLLHTGGGGADLRLADGARIVVPPLGPTIAAAGQVQRPGIYELPPGGVERMAEDLLVVAGGPLRAGPSVLRLSTIVGDGSERVVEIGLGQSVTLSPGDIVMLAPARGDRRRTVSLLGHVHAPGPRPLADGMEAADLLADRAARDDAYLPMAVLVGLDEASGARRLTPVHADGGPGPALSDGDALVLFGPEDIAFLSSRAVLRLIAAGTGRTAPEAAAPAAEDALACPGLAALASRIAADGAGPLAWGPVASAAGGLIGPDLPCPTLFETQPDLLPMALEHAVLLREGVLRPGFYPAAPGVATADLIAAAGGATGRPVAGLSADGSPLGDGAVRAGIVDAGEPWVELNGAVKDSGRIPLGRAGTLGALLNGGQALADDAYGLFAVLERQDRQQGARLLIPFAPAEVIGGGFDRRLVDRDRVIILSRRQVRELMSTDDDPDATVGPESPAPPTEAGLDPAGDEAPMTDPVLRRLLADRAIGLRGAVAEPGTYPVATAITLPSLIAAAGGLLAQADTASLELVAGDHDAPEPVRLVGLASPLAASLTLRPGDMVRVPRLTPPPQRGSITLAGEVREPGRFDLLPGERLSSVLARAGGLLPGAYPYGAVFTRDSARQAERQGLLRAAEELERSLAMMLLRPDPPDAGRVELARRLAGELRAAKAVGRITVEADPAILGIRPELDIVLEPGDRLYIPKRPLTVTVSGEVLSPAALRFEPGKKGSTYLMEAGGTSRNADEGRIFVLLPDGSARPLSAGAGRHGVEAVPPGSSIIVPRDPDPYDFLAITQTVTTILSQLALTALAVTNIGD